MGMTETEGLPEKLIADCKEAAARLANQADGHRLADAVLQMATLVVNLNCALGAACDLAEKATAHLAADRQVTIAEASPSASADEAEPAPEDRDRRSLIQRLDMLSTRLSEVSWGSKSTRQRVKSLLHEAITALAAPSSPPAAEPSEAEVEAAAHVIAQAIGYERDGKMIVGGNRIAVREVAKAALIAERARAEKAERERDELRKEAISAAEARIADLEALIEAQHGDVVVRTASLLYEKDGRITRLREALGQAATCLEWAGEPEMAEEVRSAYAETFP